MAEFVLHVPDIDELGKDFSFVLSTAWLDATLQDASLRSDPAAGPGSMRVHVQLNGTEYLVAGKVQAQLLTECGRCLGDARVPVDVELAALYMRVAAPASPARGAAAPAGASPARGAASPAVASDGSRAPRKAKVRQPVIEVDDEDEDDLQRETFSGYDIVLDDLVREHLVLELPMQPLCSEACQGIAVPQHIRPPPNTFLDTADSASTTGAVDPRLAPLQRLRDNVPPSSAQASAPAQGGRAQEPRPKNQLPRQNGSETKTDTDKE
ncbi:MAG: DUF177 domain-containing protein [Polyangiales bacterium]